MIVNIDLNTQIGADGQRHPMSGDPYDDSIPRDPTLYRRVIVQNLGDLKDVDVSEADPSDVLTFDGTTWGAEAP